MKGQRPIDAVPLRRHVARMYSRAKVNAACKAEIRILATMLRLIDKQKTLTRETLDEEQ